MFSIKKIPVRKYLVTCNPEIPVEAALRRQAN